MRIVVTSVNDRRLAKTRLSSAIPNTAVIAGAIAPTPARERAKAQSAPRT
jgi:hypothetical protein